jgi:hypothetical protein
MKMSCEGLPVVCGRLRFDSPIFIRFLLHRRQPWVIFPLRPTPESREGRPKGFHGSGDGTLLTVTVLTDLRTRKCSGPHPPALL